jgi:hypothetical protein
VGRYKKTRFLPKFGHADQKYTGLSEWFAGKPMVLPFESETKRNVAFAFSKGYPRHPERAIANPYISCMYNNIKHLAHGRKSASDDAT